MTVGSLFAGIGGFDLGFERAGFEIKWQVEIDPFCRAVLAKHWPSVRRYEDVRECCGNLLRVSRTDGRCAECGRRDWVPWVHVLVGGFPCQDISPAGRRAGIRGKQSGLWSEYRRLICDLRPDYVVVENSSNLLADGYGIDVLLGELAEIRYDAEWDCLPVSAFGAPHERDRVWIVAYPAGRSERRALRPGSQRIERAHNYDNRPNNREETQSAALAQERAGAVPDADGSRRFGPSLPIQRRDQDDGYAHASGDAADAADAHQARQPLVFGSAASAELARFRAASSGPWWSTEPEVVRVVHGVSERLVRRQEQHPAQIGGLGNAVSPFIAEWIARRILDAERGEA